MLPSYVAPCGVDLAARARGHGHLAAVAHAVCQLALGRERAAPFLRVVEAGQLRHRDAVDGRGLVVLVALGLSARQAAMIEPHHVGRARRVERHGMPPAVAGGARGLQRASMGEGSPTVQG